MTFTPSYTALLAFLINAWFVRSIEFKEYWQYSFENKSISLSADTDSDYTGPSSPMIIKANANGNGDYIFEQIEPQRSSSRFGTLYRFVYDYQMTGNAQCSVSYRWGNNSEYITLTPSQTSNGFVVDIFEEEARTKALFIKMETIGDGQCEWQQAEMEYPDYGEECELSGDDECIVTTRLTAEHAADTDIWNKVGCYNSHPYYFTGSSAMGKYLCKILNGGWFISSTECGTYQQEEEWYCQNDAVFGKHDTQDGSEQDRNTIHDVYRCNGVGRWYRDYRSDASTKQTTLITSCTNVSMVEAWESDALPICMHVSKATENDAKPWNNDTIDWTEAVFEPVDTLTVNDKPIYYLLGEGEYYPYNDYNHPSSRDGDGKPQYRDGVVYYIYWMDGDALGEVDPAWVLIPNRVYPKYSDEYAGKDNQIRIGRIIGQCFEENIMDCGQQEWNSDFYHLAVNGEECADIIWEGDETTTNIPATTRFEEEDSKKKNEGVVVGVIIGFALLFVTFGIAWLVCKFGKGKHEMLEPLSDAENGSSYL